MEDGQVPLTIDEQTDADVYRGGQEAEHTTHFVHNVEYINEIDKGNQDFILLE